MSLIATIKTKVPQDLLNGGAVGIYTGQASSATNQVIATLADERQFAVSGFMLTSATSIEARLAFRVGSTNTEFFRGFCGPSGAHVILPIEAWIWSDLSLTASPISLVITTAAGVVDYTVMTKIFASKTPLGYIQQIGTQEHANPYFGPESGLARGQSEF